MGSQASKDGTVAEEPFERTSAHVFKELEGDVVIQTQALDLLDFIVHDPVVKARQEELEEDKAELLYLYWQGKEQGYITYVGPSSPMAGRDDEASDHDEGVDRVNLPSSPRRSASGRPGSPELLGQNSPSDGAPRSHGTQALSSAMFS